MNKLTLTLLIIAMGIFTVGCGTQETGNQQSGGIPTAEDLKDEFEGEDGKDSGDAKETNGDEEQTSNEYQGAAIQPALDLKVDNGVVKGTYKVKNEGDKEKEFTFSSSQRIHYVIKTKSDEIYYDSSSDKSYIQVMSNETLKQGEELEYQFESKPLPVGEYKFEIWLTAKNTNLQLKRELIVDDSGQLEEEQVPPVLEGGGDEPKSDPEVKDEGDTPVSNEGIVAGSIEPSLTLSVQDNVIKGTYKIKNQTERVQELTFSSSQRIHYVIKDEQGEVLYDSSSDKLYMQVIGHETLKQGEELEYMFESKPLPVGSYTFEIWLTANNTDAKIVKSVTVE